MKAKHAVLVTLSFVTAAAMAVPTRNILQSAPDSETACTQTMLEAGWKYKDGDPGSVHCPRLQSTPSVAHDESASTARRVAQKPQLDTASKRKLMGLMALFVSARASQ